VTDARRASFMACKQSLGEVIDGSAVRAVEPSADQETSEKLESGSTRGLRVDRRTAG
jgi:hypothetical protein